MATISMIGSYRAAAGAAIVVRRLDRVAVYGRMQGIAVYELLGMAAEARAAPPAWVHDYEAGLDAYAGRRWQEAIARFEAAAAGRGGEHPSEIFIERCRRYLASPPPETWTPVSVLDGK